MALPPSLLGVLHERLASPTPRVAARLVGAAGGPASPTADKGTCTVPFSSVVTVTLAPAGPSVNGEKVTGTVSDWPEVSVAGSAGVGEPSENAPALTPRLVIVVSVAAVTV